VHCRLKDQRILTSLRTDRQGKAFIRVSPHFYNNQEDLHKLLRAL
jgi:selenocysteine lyase/cysteine desulfurase